MKIKLTKNQSVGPMEIPYIIAEIGSNHNGDMKLCKNLIDEAKKAGADCVKFQTFSSTSLFSKQAYKNDNFINNDKKNKNDLTLEKMVKKYSISKENLLEMKKYSEKINIDFAATPFSYGEVDYLTDILNVNFIKIASMDLNNYPLLDYIARKKKPMILSTGLSELTEIDRAIKVIEKTGNKNLVILHCVATYPPEDKKINLRNIESFSKIYPYPIGFSDHTEGTCVTLAAIAKGACLIEKHFTLDKNMEGWDHKMSANPKELKTIVDESKRVFFSLGSSRIQQVESKESIENFRRSIVASKDIKKGEIFTKDFLDFKRPGTGLKPEDIKFIIGKKANRDISYDEIIKIEDF